MEKMDISPCRHMVLVKPNEKPKEVGGLILAGDQQNSAPVHGTVLRTNWRSPFKEGDTLYFRKYAIDELKFVSETGVEDTVFLIDEREVLGVIRETFSLRKLVSKIKI